MAVPRRVSRIVANTGSKGGIFEFERSLDKFAKEIEVSCDELTRQVVLACHRGVREETPVLTGVHRDNWQIEAGEPDNRFYPRGTAAATQEKKIAAHDKPSGRWWWIFNNGPAIKRLEYGWSKKKPNGMVRVTIANVRARLKEIKAVALARARGQ
jgi:hypothetical protein